MTRVFRATGFALGLIGCGNVNRYGPEDNPKSLRDVTGVEFGWSCGEKGCVVTRLAQTPPPDACSRSEDAAYSYDWGRFVAICSVCVTHDKDVNWVSTPGQCRLVACETDANCPAIYGGGPDAGYSCENGLCQSSDTSQFPRDTLNRYEVESLCFAEHPRAETLASSAASMQIESSVAAACPSPDPAVSCPLPASCRMP